MSSRMGQIRPILLFGYDKGTERMTKGAVPFVKRPVPFVIPLFAYRYFSDIASPAVLRESLSVAGSSTSTYSLNCKAQ